ncbi:MAG: hypothetical protein OHK0013_36430 [Sandaracinaceae bacterium]
MSLPVRKTTRYVVQARGQAVDLDGFRLVGERVLDASATGCLLACEREVRKGQRLLLSFELPATGLWFDVEADVVRVVEGKREGDPGYCAGLAFREFDRSARLALGVDLREHPPVRSARSPKERLRMLALAS